MSKIDEIKKEKKEKELRELQQNVSKIDEQIKVEESVLDTFMIELGDLSKLEKTAFDEIKEVRTEILMLEDYEAFALDTLDTYAIMVTHLIHKKIRFVEGGVAVKLRTPLLNADNQVIANEITVLFESNKDRERQFLKAVKTKQNDANLQNDQSDALISASLGNASMNGANVPISPQSYRKIKQKDTEIIGRCYNFFRL